MMWMGRVLAGAVICSLLAIGSASPQSAPPMPSRGDSQVWPSVAYSARINRARKRKALPSNDVTYHHGRLLPAPHIYAIYWGPSADFPPDFIQGMNDFLGAYGDTGYTKILTQYLRGRPAALPTFNPNIDVWQDASSPPATLYGLSGALVTIGSEVCKMIGRAHAGLDLDGAYLVMTSNFANTANLCAFHASWRCGKSHSPLISIAYLPNTDNVPQCSITPGGGRPPLETPAATNPYSDSVRSTANLAAHELSEIITDPIFNGWYQRQNNIVSEIADKCLTSFDHTVSLNDGYTWQLQELWSNANGNCIQSE